MATNELLTVDYHQQDTNYYCGAANAQMILDSIGAGLFDQNTLYTECNSHSTSDPPGSWYCGPDGLAWTLNQHRDGHALYFLVDAYSTEDTVSRKIVWTIHHYRVAPAALVQGGNHWVVVAGYGASKAPANSADTSYTIDEFVIDNPWPPTPAPTAAQPSPPPHSAGDICGSGGVRGVATEHVSYTGWRTNYMTPNAFGTTWKNQYVAVCDPEPPGERVGAVVAIEHPLGGDAIADASTAQELALAGIRSHRLNRRKPWSGALAEATPQAPLLVQRLDAEDAFYYVVPFANERGVSAATMIDARYGDYFSTIALDGGVVMPPRPGSRKLRNLVTGSTIELEDGAGRLRLRPEGHAWYPTMVWKPCLESLSPFWPFYLVTVGRRQIFVRIDGAIFGALHDLVGGV
jgi:hypothetical protein